MPKHEVIETSFFLTDKVFGLVKDFLELLMVVESFCVVFIEMKIAFKKY